MLKKRKKTKQKSELLIELQGQVFLVERGPGNTEKRTVLDSKVILDNLVASICRGLDLMENKSRKKK